MSGLLLFGLVTLANFAAAEPVALEVVSAEAGFDERTKAPIVSIKLSQASSRLLADISQKNVGRKADIRIDGRTLVSPVFREPILAGPLQISDKDFTVERTKALAEQISAHKGRIEIEALPE